VNLLCTVVPLERIKPVFDSIQGDFKDRWRFFSGLFFFYRLLILLTFAYASLLKSFYTITSIQLTCMLTLHAVCMPYKNIWHNILDSLLFTDLILINAIAFYNSHLASKYVQYVSQLVAVQSVLILLPLVYLAAYILYKVVMKIKAKRLCKISWPPTRQEPNDESDGFLRALDTRSLNESGIEPDNYRLLENEKYM